MNIDFVILWVDSSDERWRDEYLSYQEDDEIQKDRKYFRDWDNLQYVFRAFEEFTPWVRVIHFVTYGHLPEWMDIEHPKLNIVKHQDIFDEKHLPTFNSNAIEANIHKISGLAEYFVLFNDDLFITQPISVDRFFFDGLPCDMLISNALSSSSGVGHFVLNNLEIINGHFDKRESISKNFLKYFNYRYGLDILRNLALLPWGRFTGFVDPHQPQPFLKSTLDRVWSLEGDMLSKTSASRFRNCSDTNQYLFRYWQLVKGDFKPISMSDTKFLSLSIDNIRDGTISDIILSPKYSILSLNDSDLVGDRDEFLEAKEILRGSLDRVLPNRSSFET